MRHLTGNVLLVEDDSDVRTVTRAFLEDTGLTILEAATSEDALHMVARGGATLCLLVTDLMLPGKDGVSLATELRSSSPELKVIIISGYTEHRLPDPTTLQGAKFLSKPFSRWELLGHVLSLVGDSVD